MSERSSHAYEVANELYKLFLLEATIDSNLQKIIDHVLNVEDRHELYRLAWISGLTWSLMHAERIQKLVDEFQQKSTNN